MGQDKKITRQETRQENHKTRPNKTRHDTTKRRRKRRRREDKTRQRQDEDEDKTKTKTKTGRRQGVMGGEFDHRLKPPFESSIGFNMLPSLRFRVKVNSKG